MSGRRKAVAARLRETEPRQKQVQTPTLIEDVILVGLFERVAVWKLQIQNGIPEYVCGLHENDWDEARPIEEVKDWAKAEDNPMAETQLPDFLTANEWLILRYWCYSLWSGPDKFATDMEERGSDYARMFAAFQPIDLQEFAEDPEWVNRYVV